MVTLLLQFLPKPLLSSISVIPPFPWKKRAGLQGITTEHGLQDTRYNKTGHILSHQVGHLGYSALMDHLSKENFNL